MSEKFYDFTESTPLKVKHFNYFMQDSQIVQATGDSPNHVMSQSAVSKVLKNFEYGYGVNFSSVYHAKGIEDKGVLVACAETSIGHISEGTTVIVKMNKDYHPYNNCAMLRAGNKEAKITVNAVGGSNDNYKREIYYGELAANYYGSEIARNIFLKDVSYEFYYDGETWVLKNYVVSASSNCRIWADGFTEQWGYNTASGSTLNINFSHPLAQDYYFVTILGAYSNVVKTRNGITISGVSSGKSVGWYACGY